MLTGRAAYGVAFLLAMAVILAQIALKRPDRLQPDEQTYLKIITALAETGTFTDGDMTPQGSTGSPGRFIAPAYPALVAALARLDSSLGSKLVCLAGMKNPERHGCGSLWSLYLLNAALAALGIVFIMSISETLSHSRAVAWGSAAVALASLQPAEYARLLLTDTLATTTFLGFLAGVVALSRKGASTLVVLAGLAIGLATLTRPSFAYVLYLVAAGLTAIGLLGPRLGTTMRWWQGPLLLATGLAVLAPWMVRNALLFGDSALTEGYGPLSLAQRVSYNAMTWAEWGAAWIFWLPDIGDDLARVLFPPDLTARLGWNAPTTFYQVGNGRLMQDTLAAAGGPQHHLSYLIRVHVLGDILKHSAVTLVLAWRGLWVGKWLAVVALILLWPVAREVVRRGGLAPLLALCVPLVLLVGLHAFVSVSIVRYNLPLLALFSFVIAFAGVGLWARIAAARAARRQEAET